MRRKLKLMFILPSIQLVLTTVAVIIDQGVNHGLGEGENQVLANLVSNIEFSIKLLLGYDDIVNYNFRLITVLLATGFWYLTGLSSDKLMGRVRNHKRTFN